MRRCRATAKGMGEPRVARVVACVQTEVKVFNKGLLARLACKEGKATPCGRWGRWGEESHGQPVAPGTPPVTAHTFSSHLVPRRKTLVILFFTHV